MKSCDRLKACPFFNDQLADTPHMAERMKTKYCLSEPASCGRRMVGQKLGREAVPTNLFPGDTKRALEMIQ